MVASRAKAILIAGPTGSGKSALALRLAERIGGTVINADAMQVYADLAILTARPSAAEMEQAPHRLYGTVDAAVPYSVARWLADVAAILDEVGDAPAIIVGGTGLYFKALTQGLSAIPAVPDAVRQEVRVLAADRSPAELHALLAAGDPHTAARLRASDPQRIVRALEVHRATGGSLAAYQARREPPLLPAGRWRGLTLAPDRDQLRASLDRRFDAMVAAGALAEVERLAARALDPSLPAMRAHGVPPLLAHRAGRLSLDKAVNQAKRDTRRYVKRQDTFARHQLAGFEPVAPGEAEGLLRAYS